jgi:uncharacterized SAM-dependent methyltransferase
MDAIQAEFGSMDLVAEAWLRNREQEVRVQAVRIHFVRGESIWTGAAYNYNPSEFAALAASAGWQVDQVWTDDRGLSGVHYLTVL